MYLVKNTQIMELTMIIIPQAVLINLINKIIQA